MGEKGPKAIDHEEESHLLGTLGLVLDSEVRSFQSLLTHQVERYDNLRSVCVIQSLNLVKVLNECDPKRLFIRSDHIGHVKPEELYFFIFKTALHLSLCHVCLDKR
jgi:hypothetical protein